MNSTKMITSKIPGFFADASFSKNTFGYYSASDGINSEISSNQVVMSMPHPCDRACECCGQWNVQACCDYCWKCWINS